MRQVRRLSEDAEQVTPPEAVPRHIAIIMDGNGRWARSRGLPRVAGHRAGMESVRAVVRECSRLGVGVLTLYAFSTENWRRPEREVSLLMRILREYLRREVEELDENDVRLRAIGRIAALPEAVQAELRRAEEITSGNGGLQLNLALNYGGRAELVDAVRAIAHDVLEGRLSPDDVDEGEIAARLYTAGQPDPDLLIRTSGEARLSNFLLWQSSYTEIWITPVLWPDFREEHLRQAIAEYSRRQRRFGGVEPASGKA